MSIFSSGVENAGTKTPQASASSMPSRAMSCTDSLRKSNRRIVVMGAGGTGKTTFSISASKFAGDSIPARDLRKCADVAVFQGDNEGVAGAQHAGFEPAFVYDLSPIGKWAEYKSELAACLRDLKGVLDNGTVKILVIDLAHPTRLINDSIDPQVQKDWKLVAMEGMTLFRALSGLRGVTVIGNAQIKAATGFGETAEAAAASNAKASGGERSTYAIDLLKGVATLWVENSSLLITRELKRTRGASAGEIVPKFFSHTQSGAKFEAKSRFRDALKPTEPGDITLRSLLERAYGASL